MTTLNAALIEIERHDWERFRCGCGQSALHVPDIFRQLLQAKDPSEVAGVSLADHLEIESMIFEVAVPSVSVILAGLGEELEPFVRVQLLEALWRLVTGESHVSEVRAGRAALDDECVGRAREGLWVLYAEAASGDTDTALEVLDSIERDRERFDRFKDSLRDRVRAAH
jgi:hypothetical protein